MTRTIPSRLNFAILLAQLAAIWACLLAVREVPSGWPVAAVAFAFAIAVNSAYALVHEAAHGVLFRNRARNDLGGAALALLFPASFHLIRHGHLVHHLRNRSDDEAFDLYFDEDNKAWRYLQFYGILTGFYWLMAALSNVVILACPWLLRREYFGFDRTTAGLLQTLNPARLGWIRLEALAAVLLHAGIVWGLGIPPWRYAALYAVFGWTWSAMQYTHHFRTERDVLSGARNLRIWRPLDLLLLNHDWHRVHHEHPTVPWIHLPRMGREAGQKLGSLPRTYLKMWTGPRHTAEHVENRYAGTVIR